MSLHFHVAKASAHQDERSIKHSEHKQATEELLEPTFYPAQNGDKIKSS